jgi:transcription initiation factor TFIIB
MSRAENGCPECAGTLNDAGDETVCAGCGLVVEEDRIDRGPEWRAFADDADERERTGAPLTRSRHDRGLTTEIGRSTRVKGRKRRRLARMRRQHDRTQIKSKAERNQVYGFTEIRRVVGALELPDRVRDQACRLFESAQSEDLLRGRSLEGFAAATVYAACRTAGIARTRKEVLEPAKADGDELSAAYDALNRELGLPLGPIDPAEYLARFATKLDLDATIERRARELLSEAPDGAVGGRDPGGVAAAALYAAASEQLTQAEAAEVGGVSPVTLRSAYYALRG